MSSATERLAHQGAWIRIDPHTSVVTARAYRLTVTSGPDVRKSVAFTGPLVVGTSPTAGLVLTDSAVSREHVVLTPRGDGVHVADRESTNGTFVGAVKVQEAFAQSDATLKVGRTTLHIKAFDQELGIDEEPTAFGAALGQSRAMRRLFGLLGRVAPSDSPVLLLGETGTGKEVISRAIHAQSARKTRPFVVFDCGAAAPSVIESELFGHVKGAFTGASSDRRGAFSQANGGTLLLDEVGELPLELQPRLLRVLESGTIKRLGEDGYRSVDVRVIAATHRNLEAEVDAGRFRQDLYFRLAVAVVHIPPLRERHDDITALVHHFLSETGRGDFELPEQLLTRLLTYHWPGNVRELRNVVARAVLGDESLGLGSTAASAAGAATTAAAAPTATAVPGAAEVSVDLPFKEAKDRLVDTFTRDYLAAVLERHGGNITRAAEAAGLARPYLHKLVTKYGLRVGSEDP